MTTPALNSVDTEYSASAELLTPDRRIELIQQYDSRLCQALEDATRSKIRRGAGFSRSHLVERYLEDVTQYVGEKPTTKKQLEEWKDELPYRFMAESLTDIRFNQHLLAVAFAPPTDQRSVINYIPKLEAYALSYQRPDESQIDIKEVKQKVLVVGAEFENRVYHFSVLDLLTVEVADFARIPNLGNAPDFRPAIYTALGKPDYIKETLLIGYTSREGPTFKCSTKYSDHDSGLMWVTSDTSFAPSDGNRLLTSSINGYFSTEAGSWAKLNLERNPLITGGRFAWFSPYEAYARIEFRNTHPADFSGYSKEIIKRMERKGSNKLLVPLKGVLDTTAALASLPLPQTDETDIKVIEKALLNPTQNPDAVSEIVGLINRANQANNYES